MLRGETFLPPPGGGPLSLSRRQPVAALGGPRTLPLRPLQNPVPLRPMPDPGLQGPGLALPPSPAGLGLPVPGAMAMPPALAHQHTPQQPFGVPHMPHVHTPAMPTGMPVRLPGLLARGGRR